MICCSRVGSDGCEAPRGYTLTQLSQLMKGGALDTKPVRRRGPLTNFLERLDSDVSTGGVNHQPVVELQTALKEQDQMYQGTPSNRTCTFDGLMPRAALQDCRPGAAGLIHDSWREPRHGQFPTCAPAHHLHPR